MNVFCLNISMCLLQLSITTTVNTYKHSKSIYTYTQMDKNSDTISNTKTIENQLYLKLLELRADNMIRNKLKAQDQERRRWKHFVLFSSQACFYITIWALFISRHKMSKWVIFIIKFTNYPLTNGGYRKVEDLRMDIH